MEYKTKQKFIEDLVNNYGDMVYRLALSRTRNKEMAEDIYQDVFMKIAKRMPTFETNEHEKAYILKTTINLSKTLLDSKHIKRIVELKENLSFETPERNEIYYSVLELPIKYRTAIHLFYYEGYKIEEIAELMKSNENTVKSWLLRAREMLKNKIEGGIEDE